MQISISMKSIAFGSTQVETSVYWMFHEVPLRSRQTETSLRVLCLCSFCLNFNSLILPFLLAIGSIVYFGMMLGAFFWGGMSDKVGRRQCLLICMSIHGFFAFLSSFVQGYGLFLLCRMIAGFGWVFLSLHKNTFVMC